MNRKHLVLALALAATVLAAFFAPDPEEEMLAPAARSAEPSAPVRVARNSEDSVDVLDIRSRDEDAASASPMKQWVPPASKKPRVVAPPPPPPPPPPPQAPPLPFKVLGRYLEDGRLAVFLQYQDQNLVVHVGDTIADTYKVERVNGNVMTLLYLPLNQEQTLEIGPAS